MGNNGKEQKVVAPSAYFTDHESEDSSGKQKRGGGVELWRPVIDAQALTQFSYHACDGKEAMCDLQGGNRQTRSNLSDDTRSRRGGG